MKPLCPNLVRRALVLGALLAAPFAWAQSSYPDRPVRLIVPFPPGGGSDFMGRAIQARLSERLKQPVVIDNRGGAGGTLGT